MIYVNLKLSTVLLLLLFNWFPMKKSILIDFSKVVSPIWISRFIANSLSDCLKISSNEIRDIYKKNIGDMVMGNYPIDNFITEILDFAKEEVSFETLKEKVLKVPTLDPEFLDLLSSLKKEFNLYLASDIFPELGRVVKEYLADYFDEFIFSFEMDSKKSQEMFWEKLANRIDLSQSILFIDDKKENLLLAEKYGVEGVEYHSLAQDQEIILQKLSDFFSPNW